MDDQANQFQDEILSVIKRFRAEYDLSYATAIGVLEIIKHDLMEDCPKEDGE